jgi:glycosyltransferase involved in cell wall biosynthesis
MPTRNRRRFVGQSIWYFLRQDYPARELVILDDGDDAVGDLVPDDDRIRYVRVDSGLTLGAKRNLAIELAHGDVVAHWDDDDWIAADRLSKQVAALEATGADLCGASTLLHLHLEAGEAWMYRYPPHARPGLVGCTIVYRRSAWERHSFEDEDVGEDSRFIRALGDRIAPLDGFRSYVALIHEGNTSAKNLGSPCWERRPLTEVTQLIGLDRAFYVDVRNGHCFTRGDWLWRQTSTVTVGSTYMLYDGYGSMAEYLVRGLARAGSAVNVVPFLVDREGLSEEFLQILDSSRPEPAAPYLYFSWPSANLERFRTAGDLFINTMWEASRLPRDWPPRLNQARALIVPTRFVAQVCRESGVDAPIEVVPEGIDPTVYHYEDRPEHEGFTTLAVGTFVPRKNMRVAIAAWKAAFADDATARLIVKARFGHVDYTSDDPRIEIVDSNEATRGISHWYRQADALLALGSEGFGLPLIEGMAIGLPAVALDAGGQSDTCAAAGELVLAVPAASWQNYDEPVFGRCGVYGVPSVDDVASRLRWIATHRDEALSLGKAAAEWVPDHLNVWNKAPAVLDVLEQRVRPPRPLRQTHTVWVPSWGSRCGIAEEVAHLFGDSAPVRVTATRPDLRSARVLHVHHEPSLFQDGELIECVREANRLPVPLVITEHAVQPNGRMWETDADVLVATTEHGVSELRRRWPTKWIEHIPLGCPTWFPPRKRERGRVIGAFGFLERHKGFWQLLDVVARLPRTKLVLYSYAKRGDLEASWDDAAAGLPVRRVPDFLPLEEIARRLATEADVLVFWYDETTLAAASAAARAGLATGVPVLTSPTRWFRELADVTYQPDDLEDGVGRLLDDTPLRDRLTEQAGDFCREHSWQRIADRHFALWRALEST